MRSIFRLVETAALALVVGMGASSAWSQTTDEKHESNWTVDKVLTTDPFGTIDIDAAGTSADSVKTWAQGRTSSERTELDGRCSVIDDPSYASRYADQARIFCRHYADATNTQGSSPSTTVR